MDENKPSKIVLLLLTMWALSACTSKTERDYMKGCAANGAPKELCECSYEKIEEMYPEEIFNNLEKGYIPADFMDKMVIASEQCVAEQK